MKNDAGVSEPIWSYGDILPPSLVDLIDCTGSDDEEFGEEEDNDFDDILEYLDDEDDE